MIDVDVTCMMHETDDIQTTMQECRPSVAHACRSCDRLATAASQDGQNLSVSLSVLVTLK